MFISKSSVTSFVLASSLLVGMNMVAGETCTSTVPFDLPVSAETATITLKGYKTPTIKRTVSNGGVSQKMCVLSSSI